MKDHNYIRDSGERLPMSAMTTAEIEDLLADGDVRLAGPGPADSKYWIMERLRLELDIRRWNLRAQPDVGG